MLVAYVAGPYRSKDGINGIHNNIEAARELALELWRTGFAAICPHTNTAYMDGVHTDEAFLEGDLAILSRCDLVVTLPRWRQSAGARGEVEHAEKLGIPVYHYPQDWPALIHQPLHERMAAEAAARAAEAEAARGVKV